MKNTNKFPENVENWLIENKAALKDIYILKAGFVELRPKKVVEEETFYFVPLSNNPYIDELYNNLMASPFVLDISPKDKIALMEDTDYPKFYGSSVHNYTSLVDFLKMRIGIPERKRLELFWASTFFAWRPEQFNIFFNGAVFFAFSAIDSFSKETDIGQVARELLISVYDKSDIFSPIPIAPNPAAPNIYLVTTDLKPSNDDPNNFLAILNIDKDIVLFYPDTVIINNVIQTISSDLWSTITHFYEDQMSRKTLRDTVRALELSNQNLNKLLADYFQMSSFQRLFLNKTSTNIRKKLGDMHKLLHVISALEIQVEEMDDRVFHSMDRSTISQPLEIYYKRMFRKEVLFDRNAQLVAMNFASEETSNLSIIQATVFSAIIGALFGSIATVIIQFFLK